MVVQNDKSDEERQPAWFDTEKYKGATKLTEGGWYEKLSVRIGLWETIWQSRINDTSELAGNLPPSVRALLKSLRANPLFNFFGSPFDNDDLRKESPWLDLESPQQSASDGSLQQPGFERITFRDIANLLQRSQDIDAERFVKFLESRLTSERGRGIGDSLDNQWLDEPLGSPLNTIFKIDFTLPNDVLTRGLNDFQQYFEKSWMIPAGKKLRANKFAQWCDCGLLQYIDLVTWQLERGVDLTYYELANLIFPEALDRSEETIRKTTSKQADALLDDPQSAQKLTRALLAHARIKQSE